MAISAIERGSREGACLLLAPLRLSNRVFVSLVLFLEDEREGHYSTRGDPVERRMSEMAQAYDLLVIGAGAAGSAAAHTAASQGARVLQVERDKIGGTCLNYGCDPTKTMLHIAQELYRARHSQQFGLELPLSSLEWQQVQIYVRDIIERLRGGDNQAASEQLRQQGIEFVTGEARFVSPHEVVINDRRIQAERVILAVGCQAAVPDIEGLREAGFITNMQAVSLPALPQRLAIVGGGAIGIEFAQMFQRFGVRVMVIEKSEQILDKEERELADLLADLLRQEGITLHVGAELRRVEPGPAGKRLIYQDTPGDEHELVADEILVALGRRPALEHLGLEQAGVRTTKKGIEVDHTLRTSVPHIWAAGDVATSYKFTHVASQQGTLAARNAFAEHPAPFDERVIPWVTFTDPPLAHVGSTEAELRQQQQPWKTGRLAWKAVERAVMQGQTSGQIKLLVDDEGRLLGGHILGPRADDLLAPLVLAMHASLPVAQLASALLPYPTLSEGLRWAAGQVK